MLYFFDLVRQVTLLSRRAAKPERRTVEIVRSMAHDPRIRGDGIHSESLHLSEPTANH